MPWDNKKRSRTGVGTQTPVPVPSRSQPLPSSKLSNSFPNLGGLDKTKPASSSPFRPSTPQPLPSKPSPSSTKSLPSRPTPIPAARESSFKDALLNQASTAANGQKFYWARDETPDVDNNSVSGTPTSITSSREGKGTPSQSQPTPLPAKKKQKIANNKSALPGWAKREVASSQSTPPRRREGSVRSNRSARSTPGPSTQP